MPIVDLASLLITRITPRSATRESDTYKMFAPSTSDTVGTLMPSIGDKQGGVVTSNGNVRIAIENPDRTYFYIRNMNEPESEDVLAFGYEDKPDLENDGNFIYPDEGFDVVNLQDVYVKSLSANRIKVQVEQGEG